MMQKKIHNTLTEALKKLGLPEVDFDVENTTDLSHGDYASNVAMVAAKETGKNPKELAEKIKDVLTDVITSVSTSPETIERVEVAEPGFINFHMSRKFFTNTVQEIAEARDAYGKSTTRTGEKVMVEYTDPNAFKPFHIGHLMSNAIGEALSRLMEYSGAEVKRANYFSDVGLAIAKAVWGMRALKDEMPSDDASLIAKADFLGRAYVYGVSQSDKDEAVAREVADINGQIYEHKGDQEILSLYEKGREWSLKRFDEIYEQLGSTFDYLYPESGVAESGKKIVEQGVRDGVFEKSDGAIVFRGEQHGLHTRVFINSNGIATYEAKELGLTKKKYQDYQFDTSIVITANEQDAYFAVVLEAMKHVFSEIAEKTKHISHGIMKFAQGKMSSRTGNVVTSEALIQKIKEVILQKMEEPDEHIAEQVAIGALKYAILKQSPGKDIIFDEKQALSLEGDSGPYLQYTAVRAQSVLDRAKAEGIAPKVVHSVVHTPVREVERLLHRFPDVVLRAGEQSAPQLVVHYLVGIASAFNTFYAQEKIIDKNDSSSAYKIALTHAVKTVLTSGLYVLGIAVPERM